MPPTALTSEIVTPITRLIPPGIKGAYAEEVAESRIGLQIGMLGASNVTRTWRVYTTASTDNPVQVMENLPSRYGGVKVGSTFPTTGGWGYRSYMLQYFTIVDHWIGTKVWTLQGNYVPSYIAALPSTAWSFNIHSSLETQHVFTDLNGKGIGAPRYVPFDFNAGAAPPGIGRWKAVSLDPRNGTVYLTLAGGSSDNTAKELPRFLVGADSVKRTSVLSFTKIIDSFQHRYQAVQGALNAKRNVNEDEVRVVTTSGQIPFFTGSQIIGKVLLQDVVLNEIPNQAGGLIPSFLVTINLKYDPDGWQRHLRHMHKFDDGTEAPIQTVNGEFIDEEFIVNGATSLTAILGAF